jgi:molecular chaperone DnaK (HSP70)
MRDIYTVLLEGIQKVEDVDSNSLPARLQELKPFVRQLRHAYMRPPVTVDYSNQQIQAAYLIAYFPHYYQLIYSILLEDRQDLFSDLKKIKIAYFGGGPGPEIFGTIKFILSNRSNIEKIEIVLLDKYASSWEYSHTILLNHLIPEINDRAIAISFEAINLDFTEREHLNENQTKFENANFVVFQNCINEIPQPKVINAVANIIEISSALNNSAAFLISDLTGGSQFVRNIVNSIQNGISQSKRKVEIAHNVNSSKAYETMQSLHYRIPEIIQSNLLCGLDGLIPRKWLKYNYSLLSIESETLIKEADSQLSLQALYAPLNFMNQGATNALQERTFVGIDFGTSTTVVSVASLVDRKILVETLSIPQKDERGYAESSPMVHSVVAAKGNRLLFGKPVSYQKSEYQKNKDIWFSFKMDLDKGDEPLYCDSILRDNTKCKIVSPIDVTTYFFKFLKKQVEGIVSYRGLPEEIEYAVSIPASFGAASRTNLSKALANAGIGLQNYPFIDEPLAAYLNHLYTAPPQDLSEDIRNVLVVDLGAGTIDLSIIQINVDSNGVVAKNLSISKFTDLGGDVIDRLIASNILLPMFLDELREEDSKRVNSNVILPQLSAIAEKLKIKICKNIYVSESNGFELPGTALSEKVEYCEDTIVKAGISSELNIEYEEPFISYSQFSNIMSQYLVGENESESATDSINASLQLALSKSGLSNIDIHSILLNGGGCKNPYFVSFLSKHFPEARIIRPDNIGEQVSNGAAIHSLIFNTFGKSLIQPVIAESIYFKHQNGYKLLFPEGTLAPSDPMVIQMTPASDDGQIILEIPILSSEELKLQFVWNAEFQDHKPIDIVFTLSPDKELIIELDSNEPVGKRLHFHEPNLKYMGSLIE